ncbi:calcium-binding protein [Rhizobium sp. Root708]|uniref:EF-hand domain-containing protein n=1 Tax=Rhizobium sp. Root708 TaxID=1736592 RepID=UPI0006F30539|nr:EF-hand domain-containing protein [Rhizobium sp. Root708]KRB58794.1 calcium-binding protein [Rhizobium sp. Root708]
MSRNKLILAALSSVLILGGAAGTSLAAPHDKKHHQPRPQHAMRHAGMMGGPQMAMREVIFVRMLKQFDTNKDGQISKDEAKKGMEEIFAAIDIDKDGSLTPGEIRKYHEAQMAKAKAPDDEAGADEAAPPSPPPADADTAHPAPPPPPGGPDHGGMRHGGMMMRSMMMMQRIDTDENGQISKQEAEAAFDKLFTWMDRNKDGVITIDDMPDRPFP